MNELTELVGYYYRINDKMYSSHLGLAYNNIEDGYISIWDIRFTVKELLKIK